jgi:hypothetical protein
MKSVIEKLKELVNKIKNKVRKIEIKPKKKIKIDLDAAMAIVIIVIAASAIVYSIIGNNKDTKYEYVADLNYSDTLENLEQENETESEIQQPTVIAVDFNKIDTTTTEYTLLTDLCQQYVYNNYSETSKLDTKVDVTEEVYIDEVTLETETEAETDEDSTEENETNSTEIETETEIETVTEIEESLEETESFEDETSTDEETEITTEEESTTEEIIEEDPNTLYTTGIIYMNDSVLVRYINKNGKLHTIFSRLIRKDTNSYKIDDIAIENVEVADIDDKYSLLVTDIKYANSISITDVNDTDIIYVPSTKELAKIEVTMTPSNYDDSISEDNYLNIIKDIMGCLVNNDSKIEKYKDYFTEDEYNNTLSTMKYYQSSNFEISVIGTGKSDKTNNSVDRVTLIVYDKDNNNTNLIIFKLNSSNKIYDIDVV